MARSKDNTDTEQNTKDPDKKTEQFMKDNNYVWDDEQKNYKQPEIENDPETTTNSMEVKDYIPLLKLLHNNKSKLEVFLSSHKADDNQYHIKGKRSTKTIFIATSLAGLINEYSSENSIPLNIIFETAVIQSLIRNGYENKVKMILE